MTKFDLNNIDFGKLDIKNFQIPTNTISYTVDNVARAMKESEKIMAEAADEREKYKQDILTTLKNIEGNTANLTTLVNLIQSSNDNQSEIIELITELLALAKENDIEIVDSKYRQIMNKITTFTNDVQTIATLTGFATMILNILKSGA